MAAGADVPGRTTRRRRRFPRRCARHGRGGPCVLAAAGVFAAALLWLNATVPQPPDLGELNTPLIFHRWADRTRASWLRTGHDWQLYGELGSGGQVVGLHVVADRPLSSQAAKDAGALLAVRAFEQLPVAADDLRITISARADAGPPHSMAFMRGQR